jgi:hypothetical protein
MDPKQPQERAMIRLFSLLSLAVLASGCALAQAPKPIEDVEPEVTKEVTAAVAGLAANPANPAVASTALPAAEGASLLRACAAPAPLQLLRRSVDGEERTYVYRMRCDGALLVSATYGKSRSIKRLQVKPE